MDKSLHQMMICLRLLLGVVLLTAGLSHPMAAQDQDDPPDRVARLGYVQGSVSFQPAGESDWVEAVPNRPMTTGDQLWADQNSRAEVQLGSAAIRLAPNTGFSFLNLDDRTVQIQLTSGSLSISVRNMNRDDVFEIDTPNQAFSIFERGRYRVEASEDGTYTVVSVREGEGESTGNGQTYSVHAGQRVTLSGTESLNAEVVEIGGPDDFDNWADSRDSRYTRSRSAHYLSQDVVGYEDLDDYGDWRDDSNYGHVWFPNRVAAGWAPYREGHWDWISPWGWTWVDDASWGYAPFHYGRWVSVSDRWGWVAGPPNIASVYAPALVVFVGGGGGNVGWFPLGPREVYVPSYNVSREYVNRVNISNTTVNQTTITNVYNTTIINKTTTITNVTYVNRQVAGAVTAVPQRTFVSAQPVARATVAMNARELASAPMSSRAAVAPTRESVFGAKANSAGHVAAPPTALATRQIVAKATPPLPPVPFARQQQVLAAHPGQPLARHEVQTLRPTNIPAAHLMVKQAPPGKAATPIAGRSSNHPPASPSNAARPGPVNTPPGNQTGKSTGNAVPIPSPEPNRSGPNQAESNNRHETVQSPTMPPNSQPERNPPEPNQAPAVSHPAVPPVRSDRPASAAPINAPSRPDANRPETSRAEPNAPRTEDRVPRPPTAVHPMELPAHVNPAPPNTGNPNLNQKYQQQQEKLIAKQNQEHQKLQQQQEKEHQLEQKKSDEANKQQIEQKHQQQTQQLEQKHAQQQQKLQDKQQPTSRDQSKPQG